MATRTCPECGAQYVASVRRCIDCDVALVDDERPDTAAGAGAVAVAQGEGEQVGYELEGWGNQLKVTLEGMLDRAGIRRVWEAGALIVSAEDEAAVDALIATVEGDDVPDLDDEAARVAFEIDGMDADLNADLEARLRAEGIPHAWDDEGALVVAEDDEDRVTAIVDEVLDLESETGTGDGLEALERLSGLYVAVDRLQKNPHDRKLAGAYLGSVVAVRDLPVPYGFGAEDWSELLARAEELAAGVSEHAELAARAAWRGEDGGAPAEGAGEAADDEDTDDAGTGSMDAEADDVHEPAAGDPAVDDAAEGSVVDEGADEEPGDRDDGSVADEGAGGAEDGEESPWDRDRRLSQELRTLLRDYV